MLLETSKWKKVSCLRTNRPNHMHRVGSLLWFILEVRSLAQSGFFFFSSSSCICTVHMCPRPSMWKKNVNDCTFHWTRPTALSICHRKHQKPSIWCLFLFFWSHSASAGWYVNAIAVLSFFVRSFFTNFSHTKKRRHFRTAERQNTGEHICHFIPFNNPYRLTFGFWLCDKHRPLTIPIFRETLEDKCSHFIYATHIHHFQPG